MSVSTNGAVFRRFYHDDVFWPEDAYHDDHEVLVNGVKQDDLDKIADLDKVIIHSGVVFVSRDDEDGVAFDAYFRRWLKAQTTRTIIVEVPLLKLEAVTLAIKNAGGKVT